MYIKENDHWKIQTSPVRLVPLTLLGEALVALKFGENLHPRSGRRWKVLSWSEVYPWHVGIVIPVEKWYSCTGNHCRDNTIQWQPNLLAARICFHSFASLEKLRKPVGLTRKVHSNAKLTWQRETTFWQRDLKHQLWFFRSRNFTAN